VFFEQVSKLCKGQNISLTFLVTDCLKMSVSNVTKWRNGNVPKSDTVKKIAAYFNVSTDYLLGNETENRLPAKAKSLSDIESEILEIYNTLPKDKKQAFLTVARSLKSQSADK